jgi:hypothetical protein
VAVKPIGFVYKLLLLGDCVKIAFSEPPVRLKVIIGVPLEFVDFVAVAPLGPLYTVLLFVSPSFPQLPPKKEHKTRPNNKIRNRNNASVFIV